MIFPFHRALRRPHPAEVLAGVMILLGGLAVLWVSTVRSAQATTPPSLGSVSFLSSDQANMTGLNDEIALHLQGLSQPAEGKRYFAWLMPDPHEEDVTPLSLGPLSVDGQGDASVRYTSPQHLNLLLSYSGVQITEETSASSLPSLDPATWMYQASIPDLPTPGDAKHYSYLDHLRHLLAADPTLAQLGLSGGLAVWMEHNVLNLLQWAADARDNCPSGEQTALIHRHLLRIVEVLDGTTMLGNDVPPGSPLLVDPLVGRVGLLPSPLDSFAPSYLTHIELHLNGLLQAPGHTTEQLQQALKIRSALDQVRGLLQQVHALALSLVRLDTLHLHSATTCAVLAHMVQVVTQAYVGEYDPTSGGLVGGAVWIRSMLQRLSVMPISLFDNEL